MAGPLKAIVKFVTNCLCSQASLSEVTWQVKEILCSHTMAGDPPQRIHSKTTLMYQKPTSCSNMPMILVQSMPKTFHQMTAVVWCQ